MSGIASGNRAETRSARLFSARSVGTLMMPQYIGAETLQRDEQIGDPRQMRRGRMASACLQLRGDLFLVVGFRLGLRFGAALGFARQCAQQLLFRHLRDIADPRGPNPRRRAPLRARPLQRASAGCGYIPPAPHPASAISRRSREERRRDFYRDHAPRAVRRRRKAGGRDSPNKYEIETIGDLVDAIFNGNASHSSVLGPEFSGAQ